jgi:fumarate reductase (CoM/CoB) subunit A
MKDCLIIGGGLAGWMAAYECVRQGIRPCLLQDGQGASPWVHGINVPLHPADSVECFFHDTLESGQGISDKNLAKALASDSVELVALLNTMGLTFNRAGNEYRLLRPLGSSYPRVASIGSETGVSVLQALRAALKGKGEELPHTRALRLLTDGTQVTGAQAYDQTHQRWLAISAHATILASGGYCGIYPVSTNKRDSGGDGIAMAFQAGVQLCDMEFIQFEPSAAVWPKALIGTSVITTLLFEGSVLRNGKGDRFMLQYGKAGEQVGKDILTRRISEEIAKGNGTEHGGVFLDVTGVSSERLQTDYATYVQRYRAVGIDLQSEWVELAPAPHTSLGGIRIQEDGSTSLPGLFACGEVIGGLHGASRIGGNAGLETMVFGRRAGRSAATYAQTAPIITQSFSPLVSYDHRSHAERLQLMRTLMQEALWSGVNVVREAQYLQKSIQTLKALYSESSAMHGKDAQEEYLCRRLNNDILTALLTATAAQERKDTLGCHIRSDYPQRMQTPYRIVLQNGGGGEIRIQKETIAQ